MNILFIHQNFPGQFKHLAPARAALPGHRVVAMHVNPSPPMTGVQLVPYAVPRQAAGKTHRWLTDLESKVIRGEAAYRAALALKQDGFSPDVIVAHPGWGESLFLKDLWPQARLGIYSEFYYHAQGADMGFDPEFGPVRDDDACRLRMKNANYELHFPQSQGGLAPTHWQRSVFPERFRSKITVMHDGIDTQQVRPNAQASMGLRTRKGNLRLSRDDEIITFVNRNLEPYRGYHIFMRALPAILKARPKARVLRVGGDSVSYGALPPAPATAPGGKAEAGSVEKASEGQFLARLGAKLIGCFEGRGTGLDRTFAPVPGRSVRAGCVRGRAEVQCGLRWSGWTRGRVRLREGTVAARVSRRRRGARRCCASVDCGSD